MGDNQGRRITTADVAREAGLSRATVSYALNGDPQQRLTVETRRAVLRAAERLGYQPSAAARLLRGGRSRTVLMLSSPSDGYDSPMGTLVTAFSAGLAEHGLSLIWQLAVPGAARPVGELTPALVVTAATSEDEQFAAFTAGFDVPVVPAFEGRDAHLAAAARAQIKHVAGRGYRKVVFVGPENPGLRTMVALRRAAARRAAQRLGLTWLPPVLLTSDRARAAARIGELAAQSGPLVVCAYNDEVALAVLAAAHDAGLDVPGRLAVIGVDDVPAGLSSIPALTTVRADLEGFVTASVGTFVAATEGRPFETVRLPGNFEVVERASL